MTRFELPTQSGAYRWYYVDLTCGDVTAVIIFMIGSLFSSRYSAALKRGALPHQHSAVNFALYDKGVRRHWVLTEYPTARLENDGRTLRIGDSTLQRQADGRFSAHIKDRTTPWARELEAVLEFTPSTPGGEELELVKGLSHRWSPFCIRGRAHLSLPKDNFECDGRGYHDGNHGSVPLGSDVRSWQWLRVHDEEMTKVIYRPAGEVPAIQVVGSSSRLEVSRLPPAQLPSQRTGWGLQVPRWLGVAGRPSVLESSPFYARLEAEEGGAHALGEVADFARFHSPAIRWMANFRTRLGGER